MRNSARETLPKIDDHMQRVQVLLVAQGGAGLSLNGLAAAFNPGNANRSA
jgi:hypothetical protein